MMQQQLLSPNDDDMLVLFAENVLLGNNRNFQPAYIVVSRGGRFRDILTKQQGRDRFASKKHIRVLEVPDHLYVLPGVIDVNASLDTSIFGEGRDKERGETRSVSQSVRRDLSKLAVKYGVTTVLSAEESRRDELVTSHTKRSAGECDCSSDRDHDDCPSSLNKILIPKSFSEITALLEVEINEESQHSRCNKSHTNYPPSPSLKLYSSPPPNHSLGYYASKQDEITQIIFKAAAARSGLHCKHKEEDVATNDAVQRRSSIKHQASYTSPSLLAIEGKEDEQAEVGQSSSSSSSSKVGWGNTSSTIDGSYSQFSTSTLRHDDVHQSVHTLKDPRRDHQGIVKDAVIFVHASVQHGDNNLSLSSPYRRRAFSERISDVRQVNNEGGDAMRAPFEKDYDDTRSDLRSVIWTESEVEENLPIFLDDLFRTSKINSSDYADHLLSRAQLRQYNQSLLDAEDNQTYTLHAGQQKQLFSSSEPSNHKIFWGGNAHAESTIKHDFSDALTHFRRLQIKDSQVVKVRGDSRQERDTNQIHLPLSGGFHMSRVFTHNSQNPADSIPDKSTSLLSINSAPSFSEGQISSPTSSGSLLSFESPMSLANRRRIARNPNLLMSLDTLSSRNNVLSELSASSSQNSLDYLHFLSNRPFFWEYFSLQMYSQIFKTVFSDSQTVTEKCGLLDISDSLLAQREDSNKLKQKYLDIKKLTIMKSLPQITSPTQISLIFSNIASALSLVKIFTLARAYRQSFSISTEVSWPFFFFDSSDVINGDTRFKSEPALSNSENRKMLLSSLFHTDSLIQIVGSFHFAVPEKYKFFQQTSAMQTFPGDFQRAVNGFFSLGGSLPALWTAAMSISSTTSKQTFSATNKQNESSTEDKRLTSEQEVLLIRLSDVLSRNPARICRLHDKGSISINNNADFIIFDPNQSYKFSAEVLGELNDSSAPHSPPPPPSQQHLSPHLHILHNQTVRGKIISTYKNGQRVFNEGTFLA